jgi:hypothetical protein
MSFDHASLVSRLEQLERSHQRARRIAALAVITAFALPAAAFMTQAPQDQTAKPALQAVRGTAFEVVDSAGKVRARLGLDKDGAPELRLFDAKEKVRVRAGIHKDTDPILALVDDDDKNRIAMVYDGNPHFVLSRPGGKPVIHMTAASQGDACLLFTHLDGHHNSVIGLKANGDAILTQNKPSASGAGDVDKGK